MDTKTIERKRIQRRKTAIASNIRQPLNLLDHRFDVPPLLVDDDSVVVAGEAGSTLNICRLRYGIRPTQHLQDRLLLIVVALTLRLENRLRRKKRALLRVDCCRFGG